MTTIGTFKPSRQGRREGSVQTLAIDRTLRFVPNDNRVSEHAPAFRIMMGPHRVGDAWKAQTSGEEPREYLRVRLDDPSFHRSLQAALFPNAEGRSAQLVWDRAIT